MPHLDPLQLELARTGEATPSEQAHLEECAACQARLGGLEALAASLIAAPAGIPTEVDARIELQIHRHFRRRRWRPVAIPAAVLALAAAAALFVAPTSRPVVEALEPAVRTASAGVDVHADGKLDILDAFALARRVEDDDARPAWDQDGDGAVDDADVELLARAAVEAWR